MRYTILIILIILISSLLLMGTGCIKKEESMTPQDLLLSNKKVLFIIAFKGFQDHEYSTTRRILETKGAKVDVASSSLGKATGKLGEQQVEINLTINEINLTNYDAVIFIGGPGALEYVDNSQAHTIAQEAIKENKILAAICIAPEILAKAGVLKGKKATVWSSIIDRSPIEVLENAGANYVDEEVVVDGNIITANGPNAAEKFAREILKSLSSPSGEEAEILNK